MRKNFVLLAGSVLVAFILLEIMMRTFGISYPYFTRVDYDTGYSLRPGAEGWQRDEGQAYIKINSDGLRDYEHSLEKPDDVLRIAVLGDSYTEAKQVAIEDTFWSVMENETSKCSDKKIEAINFGVSGFGTAQELLMLRSKVWKYNPDIVLLAFLTGNDVRNNSHALSNQKHEPWFDIKDEELILNNSFRDTRFFKVQNSAIAKSIHVLINNSRVLQLLNRIRIVALQEDEKENIGMHGSDLWGEQGIDVAVYKEPVSDEWSEAWDITENIISMMSKEVSEKGKKLLVVNLSNAIQEHPDQGIRDELKKYLGVQDLFYPDKRIEKFGQKEGFPVLSLARDLQRTALENQVFLHGFENTKFGFGHWNSEGHRMAGEVISKYICNELL